MNVYNVLYGTPYWVGAAVVVPLFSDNGRCVCACVFVIVCVCRPVILLLGSLPFSSVARLFFVGRDGRGPALADCWSH